MYGPYLSESTFTNNLDSPEILQPQLRPFETKVCRLLLPKSLKLPILSFFGHHLFTLQSPFQLDASMNNA